MKYKIIKLRNKNYMKSLEVKEIIDIIQKRYDGIVCKKAYGETAIFYNPENLLKNGVYFCTIKENDGPNDKASKLYREGVYRINVGVTKEEFIKLFYVVPKRPLKGEVIKGHYDFTAKNTVIPHPIYAWMSWICILSPEDKQFNEFLKYLDISYKKVKLKFQKRIKEK